MKHLRMLLLGLCLVGPACATTGGQQTKQTITLDVLKPTHDALATFQDLEITLFKGGQIPALTPQAHQQIEGKLEIAFRAAAAATRAVRAWQPGTPVPVDLLALKQSVEAVQSVVALIVPPKSPLATSAAAVVATVATLIQKGGA